MSAAKVHHLNCGTMCPRALALLGGPRRLVCHCLLVELGDRLVLVDAGLGVDDVTRTRARLGAGFARIAGAVLDVSECAVRQVEALGFRVDDVRDVVVTHLDLDHAGGLSDFPEARVHVHAKELAAARARATFAERERYRPAQLDAVRHWTTYDEAGESFYGFEAVRAVSEDVLLVPLFGHSRGHSGVAVRDGAGWLLHAGDAYFEPGDLASPRASSAGLGAFQRLVAFDDGARSRNRERLRGLKTAHPEVRLFSAHDEGELAALNG